MTFPTLNLFRPFYREKAWRAGAFRTHKDSGLQRWRAIVVLIVIRRNVSLAPFLEIDHIIPEAVGGLTVDHNLTLACPLCNSHKSDRTHLSDPETGELVPFFHPNEQVWREHFGWAENGAVIYGKTAVGICTVIALNMNDPDVVATRRRWVAVGWHPPREDLDERLSL